MYLIISLVFSPFIFILVASEVALYSILHDPVLFSPFIFILVASEGLIAGEALSIFAFVILFYGIAGAIGGLLIGIIYNFIAKRFGGIELEFETY